MNKRFIYIGILFPIFLLILVRGLIGFDGLYGQDGYEYLRYSRELRLFFTEGKNPGDYFWPVIYPLTGTLLSFIIPNVGLCLQLISILSLYIIFVFSNKLIQLIYPTDKENAGINYLMVVLFLSPFMLRFGFSIMADMFCAAGIIMAAYYLVKFTRHQSIFAFCLGGFFSTMAFMTRYGAVLLLVPLIIYAIFKGFRIKSFWYALPLVLICSCLPFLPHLLIRAENSVEFIKHDWVKFWSPFVWAKREYITRDGTEHYMVPNIIYSLGGLFHPRYFFLGIILTIFGFKKFSFPKELKIILAGLMLYLLFIAGIPYQNNRFLLLAFPLLILIYYKPFTGILHSFNQRLQIGLLFIITIVQLGLFAFTFNKVYRRSLLEQEIYTFVTDRRNKPIYTMDVDISLKARGYQPPIYNIWSEHFVAIDTTALVIFNTDIFPIQWAGMNPMKNWDDFNKYHRLVEVKAFKQGWKAYEFK